MKAERWSLPLIGVQGKISKHTLEKAAEQQRQAYLEQCKKGYQEGLEKATNEAAQALAKEAESMTHCARMLTELKKEVLTGLEDSITESVLRLLGMIMGEMLIEPEREKLQQMIAADIAQISAQWKQLEVYLDAESFALIQRYGNLSVEGREVVFFPDTHLALGDYKIVYGNTTVSATLARRIQRFLAALMGVSSHAIPAECSARELAAQAQATRAANKRDSGARAHGEADQPKSTGDGGGGAAFSDWNPL